MFKAIGLGLAALALCCAGDIEGTIVIKRKLTKRKVTVSAGLYDRGVAVDLGSKGADDPIAFERAHVAVYLEGQLPTQAVTASMDQENRKFLPDLLVISAGSTVSFPNLDPIFHNVFSLSKPKTFDLGNYPKGQTRTVMFSKPGIVFVNCHLHPNMAGVIVVTPNRWCTKVDAAGGFTLPQVPAGRYTIVAWHKNAGFFRQTVEVREARTASVQFFIPLEASTSTSTVAQR